MARPAVGASRVVRIRTAVVLPAPLGPSSPRTVPDATSRSTPSNARVLPNDLARPSAWIITAIATSVLACGQRRASASGPPGRPSSRSPGVACTWTVERMCQVGITRWWEPGWDPAGSLPEQPQVPGAADGLGPVGRPQLVQHMADVALDGVQADHQLSRDALVGPAVGQQREYLQLAGAERLDQPRGHGPAGPGTGQDRQSLAVEGLDEPVQVAPDQGGGGRRLGLGRAGGEPAEQAGHGGALVQEHPQVALGGGQPQGLDQRRQGAVVVIDCLQAEGP